MQKRRLKKITLWGLVFCALVSVAIFLYARSSVANNVHPTPTVWGVDFSASQAMYLGLDPHEVYSAIIHDLQVKHIKIHINWNATEPAPGVYDFASLDRHVAEAERNHVKLIMVVGMKTGRWPECHTPAWLETIPAEERQEKILTYVTTLVNRYKDSSAVQYWQLENEPFLEFGECPDWYYEMNTELVELEAATVRKLDPSRQIIISESGELSDWTAAASIADIVGVTMYRSTWNNAEKTFGINPYSFLAPEYYAAKAAYIKHIYGKPVISIELQAEPWTAKPLAESKLEVQAQSMNPELFRENVAFAKQTGLGAYYFWGVEWWYWMKTVHNQPEIWNEAKQVFAE